MPLSPAATAHGGHPDQVTVSHRTATTTEMTSSPSPCVHATTATAGCRREATPAKKSEVPQAREEARASTLSTAAAYDAARAPRRGPVPGGPPPHTSTWCPAAP